MNDIPKGRTKADIQAREKLIKDFYAQWNAEHPDKKVWNRNMGVFLVKSRLTQTPVIKSPMKR